LYNTIRDFSYQQFSFGQSIMCIGHFSSCTVKLLKIKFIGEKTSEYEKILFKKLWSPASVFTVWAHRLLELWTFLSFSLVTGNAHTVQVISYVDDGDDVISDV